MKVSFWGVRGCVPAPGPEFNRYGGNTPCVCVETDDQGLFVLDAGTGLIGLGQHLMQGAFGRGEGRLSLLLTHTHWDHIEGFPFFSPLYVPGNEIRVYGVSGSSAMLGRALEGQFNPHFSPIHSLSNLGAEITLHELNDRGTLEGTASRIRVLPNPHGHIRALAFRFEEEEASLVYAPDVGYVEGVPSDEACQFYRHARYLIHDCTYSPDDAASRGQRGYASIAAAAAAAARAQVAHLVMFHYDQDYTDDEVDRLRDHCRKLLDDLPGGSGVELIAAHEGLTLKV